MKPRSTCFSILFVSLQRQVQQRLPVARNGGQLLAFLPGLLGRAPSFARVEQGDRLQEIGVADTGKDTGTGIRRTEGVGQAAVPPLGLLGAIPVLTQLMAGGRIHRRDQFEGVQRHQRANWKRP